MCDATETTDGGSAARGWFPLSFGTRTRPVSSMFTVCVEAWLWCFSRRAGRRTGRPALEVIHVLFAFLVHVPIWHAKILHANTNLPSVHARADVNGVPVGGTKIRSKFEGTWYVCGMSADKILPFNGRVRVWNRLVFGIAYSLPSIP